MNKRLAIALFLLVSANRNQIRAQTSPAFTAVSADYFGCDPAVKSTPSDPASCLPKTMYTKYVDPNIGTAMVTSTHPPAPTNTLINKTDGIQVQALHEISAYYSMKINANPNPTLSAANCMRTGATLLGKETILGIETYKYQNGNVEPGNPGSTGVDGFIAWLAPSLNCFSLRSEFHFKASPTTFQLTSNVTLGTPPASAFEPPPGFVETSPLEAQHKITILMMQRGNPGMTRDEAEAAWVKTSATNVGVQRQEAVWRKQHGATK
jgi:hypothetical protein